jgi:hypothetical protein
MSITAPGHKPQLRPPGLDAITGASHGEVRMVDDDPERFALAGQYGSWLLIEYFRTPSPDDDAGFAAIAPVLRAHFGAATMGR